MGIHAPRQNSVKVQDMPLLSEELKTLLSCMHEGVEIVDALGNIIYVNPAFLSITGFKPEERIGKNIFDVNPEGILVKVLASGLPLTGVKVPVLGKAKDVVGNVSPIYRNGCLIGVVAVCQDISEIINLSKRLVESETIKDSLLATLGVAKYSFSDIYTCNPIMEKTIEVAKKIALSDVPVLIQGESGVGKELFAHAIHNYSLRKKHPFIPINCAAIPENLLESELFGYEKGAFTGAAKKRLGLFELANGGTLFLDEIADMGTNLQAKLLRVLQEHEIRRLGGSQTIKINVRVIAATNQNIYQMVQEGKFRNDLYYRLNTAPLNIPPLHKRKEDIPLLIDHFLNKFGKDGKKYQINQNALDLLMKHDWPGNVRELESVIHYAVLICNEGRIALEDIIPKLPYGKDLYNNQLLKPLEKIEHEAISLALQIYGDTVEGKKKAAKSLGISLGTLYNKLKKIKP